MGETFTGLSGKTKEDFGHGDAEFVTYMNVFTNPIAASNGTENVEIDGCQSLVQYGDVLFTTSSETPEEVGMSSIWLENRANVYLNSFCFGYRLVVNFDPHYIAFMLRSAPIRKKFIFLAQGISRYNISKNKVMEMTVPMPKLNEQKIIGVFFTHLDNLITLHQRKLDKMKELKKAFLDLIFSQKLRFEGFTESWELRKFGDMADYKKGPFGSALKKEIFIPKSDDSVKVYEQQNAINKNWKLERYFITKSYAKKLNAFETHSGDILISCAGTIGEMYELPDESEPGIINQALMRVRVNEKVVSKKLYKLLFNHMIEDFSKEYSNGSAIKNIPPFADLKPMTAMVPSVEEQFQLSGFFANLDNLIALHQKKIDSLKEMKKILLKNMLI